METLLQGSSTQHNSTTSAHTNALSQFPTRMAIYKVTSLFVALETLWSLGCVALVYMTCIIALVCSTHCLGRIYTILAYRAVENPTKKCSKKGRIRPLTVLSPVHTRPLIVPLMSVIIGQRCLLISVHQICHICVTSSNFWIFPSNRWVRCWSRAPIA
jgi:hypothetical protein